MANLHMVNVSALDFHVWQYIEDNSETQLQHLTTIPLIPLHQIYQHMINGTQHIMPFNTTDESTEDTFSIWTLFSHTGMYVTAYRLAYTSRIGNILLLLLLVLTCHISALTFTTRYHAIYNCGWWCWGSTHLQMWWQGFTSYKNLMKIMVWP